MSREQKRDRVPVQDFMDKDFEIKQIEENIKRAQMLREKNITTLEKNNKLKTKYNKSTKTKENSKKYFFELYTGMDMNDFEKTFEIEGNDTIPGMYSLLNAKIEEKKLINEREISYNDYYIDQLEIKKTNITQYREQSASQAAQKAAEDAITPEAIKAVEDFDKQLSNFQTYADKKFTFTEKYNKQVDATHRIWDIGKPKSYTKTNLHPIINNLHKSVERGQFNYLQRKSKVCWAKLKAKLKKTTLRDEDEYPDIILPLIYKTLIFCIPFTRQAISLKSQAKIRINQLPDVIESEAPEDIKNLKLSFDYLKAELQNLNSNIKMANSIRFLECMITIKNIQKKIPRKLQPILNSIINNFPVETDIESQWLEITKLDEKIKKMEKIRREMADYGYVERSPEEIMEEDAARDINSWMPGSGVKPLLPEGILKLQCQMYREAGKPIPYWCKPNFKPNKKRIVKSRENRARAAVRNAGAAATRKLNSLFKRNKKEGGRRKKTRKKRRKAKRTRKKRKKRRK